MLKKAYNRLVRFCREQEALTTVEYAIAGTLVTLAVVGAFTALGGAVAAQITTIVGFL